MNEEHTPYSFLPSTSLLDPDTPDLGGPGPKPTLGAMIQVQCSTMPILQGRPHSHISKTILVQIRKGTHGKAKPSILGRFWLKHSLECQQGLLVEGEDRRC